MRARLVAGAVGIAIVAATSLIFLQTRHPQVAGTNSVAPFAPAWAIPGGGTRCQLLHRLPAGANRLRIVLSRASPGALIRAEIDRRGTPVAGGVTRAQPGDVNVKLAQRTIGRRRVRLCIFNGGKERLVFLGEHKRSRKPSAAGSKHPVPSVVFLKPGTSSWLGRAGTIIKRFGYVQAGVLGGWALWLAAALGVAMFALALWAVIGPLEPRPPPAAPEGSGRTIRAQLARIPTPGWVCAIVALLSALTWSLIVPLFQVPDEQAHVAYAQHLAEVGAPPAGHRDTAAISEEERRLLDALHWRQITHRPENPPLRTPRAQRNLERVVDRSDGDRAGKGGLSNATQNPPLYYSVAAAAYRLSPFTDLPDRVHAMRIASALLAALTALLAYLFVRELLPSTPWAWTVGGLAVALQPMFGFIGGGVNNDNLLLAASAGVLLALVIAFRRGLSVRRGVAIGACTAVGLLTKATMIGLLPGIVVGVGLLVLRAGPADRREAWRGAAAAAGIVVVPFLLYMVLNAVAWDRGLLFGSPQAEGQRARTAAIPSRAGTLSGYLSYVWQFYLPRLEVMSSWFPTYEAREIWFEGFIGRFGWLDYEFPGWVYDVGLVGGAAVLLMAARELIRRLDAIRRRVMELIAWAVIVVGLLGLLAWIGYDWRLSHPGQFEQARYLLPLLAFYGGLLAIAARGAGTKWGPVAGVVIVSLALAQSVLAMLLTLTRYYG
jgi:Predicted membrane protein (DUF2142)